MEQLLKQYTRAYARKRGDKWQALLVYYDKDGKKRINTRMLEGEISKKYDAQQAALALMGIENAKLKKDAAEGAGKTIDTGLTVGDYMEGYVEGLEDSASLEKSTLIGYNTSLGYIKKHIGNVPLLALTAAKVQTLVNAMNKDGYSSSTVRKAYMLLHSGLEQAERDELIKQNPCKRKSVRLPKAGYKRPNALDEVARANLIRLLGTLARTQTTIAAYIALYTGMRQGEVAGLRWKAIDFKTGTIHVCEAIAASTQGGTYSKTPKTNQDRYIPLARGLARVLEDWREERLADYLAHDGELEGFGSLYVLGDSDGNHINPHSIGKGWTTLATLHGIKGTQGRRCTFHDLRHTFATATISQGADIRSVSDILGHANVAMTLNTYADADPHAKRRTIDLLDEELDKARPKGDVLELHKASNE